MNILLYIFWACLGIIFYNYAGYGIILLIITSIKQLLRQSEAHPISHTNYKEDLPDVTLVIAAYNEETVIEEKIANCLSLNYPKDKIKFLFITDGSNDNSPSIISRYKQLNLLNQPERLGKSAALNRAMEYVQTQITIFSDANTMLNRSAIKRMVMHYKNKDIGGVSGEKRIKKSNNNESAVSEEGLYWKYESFLKNLDFKLYTVTGAAGELFSIRTTLWEALPEDVILDEFIISTRINLKGYRIAYEPHAYALELPSSSISEEKKRKIRISAGAFQAMLILKPIFNLFRYPVLFFQFLSHRFLRWTLTPLSIPILFITNLMIVIITNENLYISILILQFLFYLSAYAGSFLSEHPTRFKFLKICYYIFFMNYSIYLGFNRFLRKEQSVKWEKSERQVFCAPN